MALKLTVNNPYDGDVEAYFKIVEVNINYLTRSSHMTLSGWISQQARLDGKQPFTSRSYDWSGDEFPFDFTTLDKEGNNSVKLAYEKIKSLSTTDAEGNVISSEFAEAEDC